MKVSYPITYHPANVTEEAAVPLGAMVVKSGETEVKFKAAAGGIESVATSSTVAGAVAAITIKDWQAATAVLLNEMRRATATAGTIELGDLIRANSARTTGAAFDATEAGNWTEFSPDIVTQAALDAALDGKRVKYALGHPYMTAATTHGHTVSASSNFTAYEPYRALSAVPAAANEWATNGVTTGTLTVEVPVPIIFSKVILRGRATGLEYPTRWKIEGSNDGTTYTAILDYTGADESLLTEKEYLLTHTTPYLFYRFNMTASIGLNPGLNKLRFYHTGIDIGQRFPVIASIISDFVDAVRATTLTGISFLTSTAVVAADSVLVGLGKLQAQITAFATHIDTASLGITGTAGAGYIDIVNQSAEPALPAAGTTRIHGSVDSTRTFPEFANEAGVMVVLGRDSVFVAKNTSGASITKGQTVYINGASGANPTVSLARADATATTLGTIGIAIEASIANNGFGLVMVAGVIKTINTSAFTAGDGLFVSAVTAGALTNVVPAYPNFQKKVGTVLTSHASNGSILVNVAPFTGGTELGTNATAYKFAGNINVAGLTASELAATDASKNVVSLPVATYPSLAELVYVKGVTSAIQTQLNAKQALLTNNQVNSLTQIVTTPTRSMPTMTANTTASGVGNYVASANSEHATGYLAWKAMQAVQGVGTGGEEWATNLIATNIWLAILFPTARVITSARVAGRVTGNESPGIGWTIQGSNDNTTWDTLYTSTTVMSNVVNTVSFTNATAYTRYRMFAPTGTGGSPGMSFFELRHDVVGFPAAPAV